MTTLENPDTKAACKSTWSPSVFYRPEKEMFHFAGYEICIYESLDSYGSMIWPGAVALCTYLDTPAGRQQVNLLDKSAIEIGAGTGLLSIVATLLGAKVTATDLPEILGNLRCNLSRNTKRHCRHPAQVTTLSWGVDLENNFPRTTHQYDYVLAADVVYHHDYLNELLVTMRHFCKSGTTLIWSNKIRYQADLAFIERFKEAFHTTLLAEKDEIRIYMATARELQADSGQTMQAVEQEEDKDQTIKEKINRWPAEHVATHSEIEGFQEEKKQRCSDDEVEGRDQDRNTENKYVDTNLNENGEKRGNEKIKIDESDGHIGDVLGTEEYCAPEVSDEGDVLGTEEYGAPEVSDEGDVLGIEEYCAPEVSDEGDDDPKGDGCGDKDSDKGEERASGDEGEERASGDEGEERASGDEGEERASGDEGDHNSTAQKKEDKDIKGNISSGLREGEHNLEKDYEKYENKVDKLPISYCRTSEMNGLNLEAKSKHANDEELTLRSPVHLDSETEIHHFLGYEITLHRPLSWSGGKHGPATSVLCKFLETERQQVNLHGKSVLELGAGTGIVAIVASLLGAWVTATDLPEVLEILTENLSANTKGRSKYSPQVEVLQWGRNLARSFPLSIYHYDFVLAADVVHDHNCQKELLDTMCHFCHRGTTLLWAHEFRRKADLTFKAQLKRALHTKLLLEAGHVRVYMGWVPFYLQHPPPLTPPS
ncbi:hypothetical protein AALO_G00285900 [Alosa alosa]|uniref:Uncharacterized protein n=1 Tax=Alosa alosa TaxID=278164 RepID=A0AAV6FFW9_9TELE|nr:hypothetical protein AALO_G00285900 [Alosa alosa]